MMGDAMPLFLSMLVAAVAALAATPVANRVAVRIGAVAIPNEARWSDRIVPRIGGIALFSGIAVAILTLPMELTDRTALLVGLTVMFGLGLVDDLRRIPARNRLLVEAVVGGAFVWTVSDGLTPELRIAAVLLGAVAIPVAVNATNLTDNADGLAATLTIASAATLAAAATIGGLGSIAGPVALVILSATAAFLVFNRPPARMFMGDCGSLTLGFALAAASVLLVRDALLIPGSTHVATAMIVPVAWAFQVGDLVMVVVTRIRRGTSPFLGGVDHTSHRLLAAGLPPMLLLVGLGVFAALVGASAALAAALAGGFALMTVLAIGLLGIVGAFEVMVARRYPARDRPEAADEERQRRLAPTSDQSSRAT
jgi:UDP-GlcNAc:undecaprenyl-phosphate/decaprenyl-phosphate GlcNAc-1-phosphate transferase